MVQTVAQAHALKQGNCAFPSFLVIVLVQQYHGQLYIFKRTHRRKQIECLKDKPDVLQSELRQNIVTGVLVNSLAHDEKLSAG